MPSKTGTRNGESNKESAQQFPNIMITGNPGVGKTTLAKRLAAALPDMKYVDFGKQAVDRGFADGWDDELRCHIVDYEKMADDLRSDLDSGGHIIDWIHGDFWDQNVPIDLVVTVTCDNTILYDRYKARDYSQAKIDENLDSEIMGEIVEENHDYFQDECTLVTLRGDKEDDAKDNLVRLTAWVEKWQKRRAGDGVHGDKSGESDASTQKVSFDGAP